MEPLPPQKNPFAALRRGLNDATDEPQDPHEVCDATGNVVAVVRPPTIIGARILWGADPTDATLPILNLPPDTIRYRLRFRQGKFAQAFVRTPGAIHHYLLRRESDGLLLCFKQGHNFTQSPHTRCTCDTRMGWTTVKCCNLCGLPVSEEPWDFHRPESKRKI